jgi:hypothetical protein
MARTKGKRGAGGGKQSSEQGVKRKKTKRVGATATEPEHCVFCHKDFDQADNGATACTVEHEDFEWVRLDMLYTATCGRCDATFDEASIPGFRERQEELGDGEACDREPEDLSAWPEQPRECYTGPHSSDIRDRNFFQAIGHDDYDDCEYCQQKDEESGEEEAGGEGS